MTMVANSRKVVKQEEVMHIDAETGEIKRDMITNTFMVGREPEYIKIYYTHVLADCMQPDGKMSRYIDFLISVAPYITYADEGEVFFVNKVVKQQIAKHLGVQERQITHYITDMVHLGMLKKLTRGMYHVNPLVIGKGKWQDIERLQYSWQHDALGDTTTVQADMQSDDGSQAKLKVKADDAKVRAALDDGKQTTIYDFLSDKEDSVKKI